MKVTSVHVYADKDGVTADYYNGDLLVLHTRRGSFRMDFGQETQIEQADDGRSMEQIPRKCESCRWFRPGTEMQLEMYTPSKCSRLVTCNSGSMSDLSVCGVMNPMSEGTVFPDFGCVMWEAMK